MPVQCTCSTCGQSFPRKPSLVRSHMYCNQACRNAAPTPATPVENRFWVKVDKVGPIPLHRPHLRSCWLWIGGREHYGHGRLTIRGIVWKAHRLSWVLHFGPIPDGLFVLHQCDNPPCVNPEHLFLGTQPDNVHDMQAKGRGRTAQQFGIANPMTKAPNGDVVIIRERYAVGGVTQKALGIEFGLSQTQIGRIVRRERRQHG